MTQGYIVLSISYWIPPPPRPHSSSPPQPIHTTTLPLNSLLNTEWPDITSLIEREKSRKLLVTGHWLLKSRKLLVIGHWILNNWVPDSTNLIEREKSRKLLLTGHWMLTVTVLFKERKAENCYSLDTEYWITECQTVPILLKERKADNW